MPLQPGQKIWRLTILERAGTGRHHARCECGVELLVWDSAVRSGLSRACRKCLILERRYKKQIDAARKAVLDMGGRLPIEMPTDSRWEYDPLGGAEELARMLEEKS